MTAMSSSTAPQLSVGQPARTSVRAGKVIVVFGTKGGVGKTLVATNLAVGLMERCKGSVCLIDLDVMAVGDLARMLNISARRSIVDLVPELKRATRGINGGGEATQRTSPPRLSLDRIVVPHASGVHVVAGPSNGRQLSRLDAPLWHEAFNALRARYDYVIVDGGKAFSDPLIAAFDAANLLLMVTSPDAITLYQTQWALGVVEGLAFPPRMVKTIMNRAKSRGSIDSQATRSAIPCEQIGEIPSDGAVVGTSINQGVPLVTAYRQTEVAKQFLRLVDVLVERTDLYVTSEDIPRHQRATGRASLESAMEDWSTRAAGSRAEGATGNADEETEETTDEVVGLKRRITDRLVRELELGRLDLSAMTNRGYMRELRGRIEGLIAEWLSRETVGVVSSHEVRERLVKEITDDALGLGPLEELLADPTVTDILVNGKDQIFVERGGKLELTTKKFMTHEMVYAVIERIIAPLGRRTDEASPMVDARLPDGSRVNVVIPPLSVHGPVLSIRKFGHVRYGLQDLIRLGTVSGPMTEFIRACVRARKNILVSGGAGSGKTTLLNGLLAFLPTGERIITIEDVAELKLAQAHWVSLEARPPNIEGKGLVTIRELFRNALRMRPDRVIIGECRGAETLDMLQAMNTGHDGSLTTIHANSPRDVASRLVSMVLMSDVNLSPSVIHQMVASAIQVIIHTARLSDGRRRVMSISEVVGVDAQMEVIIRDLFRYHQTGVGRDGQVSGDFAATGQQPTFLEEFTLRGLALDPGIFKAGGIAEPVAPGSRAQTRSRGRSEETT